jgi:hypothetical protein
MVLNDATRGRPLTHMPFTSELKGPCCVLERCLELHRVLDGGHSEGSIGESEWCEGEHEPTEPNSGASE